MACLASLLAQLAAGRQDLGDLNALTLGKLALAHAVPIEDQAPRLGLVAGPVVLQQQRLDMRLQVLQHRADSISVSASALQLSMCGSS